MFLTYFNATDRLQYNYTDVYNDTLLSILLPIMHFTSIFSIFFGILLIYIIITKTPEQMKLFKVYLIPYAFNTVCLEIVMLLFKPFLMQPFFAIYSLQLTNDISAKTILILFILMSYFAMSMIDCIVGMSAERYFVDENIKGGRPIIPSVIFSILSGTSFAYLLFGIIAVRFDSIRNMLILTEDQAETFLDEHLKGSLETINPASILIIRPDIPVNDFALGFAVFVIFIFSRYVFAAIFLVLNAVQSQMPEMNISEKLRQNNKIILRCIFAQFVGFCLLATLPSFIIVMNFYFRSKPNCINALCFLFMNCFSLYDIIVTVICIKSYRMFVIQMGDNVLNFWLYQKSNAIIPESPVFATNNILEPSKPTPVVYGKTVYYRCKY